MSPNLSSGTWRIFVSKVGNHYKSTFDDISHTFLRIVVTYIPSYTASYPQILQPSYSSLWQYQNSDTGTHQPQHWLRLMFDKVAAIAQSVQRLATGWKIRGSNSFGSEIFRTRPDRPRGWSSLLCNGYRVFSGDKAAGAWRWPPTPF